MLQQPFYEFIIYAVLIHSITKGLPYDIEISVTILKDLKWEIQQFLKIP